MANTAVQEEVTTWTDLFEGLPEPSKEPTADVVGEDVTLTDEERGARAARDRLAERMGADAKDIDVVMENLATRLMEGGVIVDIDIHRWTGMKRLLPKELGLNGKRTQSRAIRLGEKLLIPPTILRMINSLTTQLRANLDRHSFRTVWGRWVPATAYAIYKAEHDRLAKEYMGVGEALADNLDKVKTQDSGTWGELRKLYGEHARAVWCRLRHLPVADVNLDLCPGWFVEEYISKILSHMPSAGEIRDSFSVEAKISYIPLPSMLEEDRLRSDRLWEKAADERQADRKRQQAQEQMEADVRAHYLTEKKSMIDDFLGGLAGEVYSKIYDVSSRALATMSKNQGRLLEPTLRQLHKLVKWGDQMNIANDEELATALKDLQGMINRSSEQRTAEDVQDQLKAMGTVARSILVDLNVAPQIEDGKLSVAARDAVLGIGRRLSRGTVAKAREQLGTEGISELPIVQARRGKRAPVIQTIPQL